MISLDNVCFRYRRKGPLLFRDLNCGFAPGRITAITGPSGCGKSTLLYLIGLMLTPESGNVLWDGVNVSRLSDAARSRYRASSVGFVFQDAALDATRSIADNVAEGALYAGVSRSTMSTRRTALLEEFDVQLRANHRPGEVSGGQAQRVALARAMIKQPSIVLADEPTGNLDRVAANVVVEAFRRAASDGALVVVATHDAAVAALADEVLELSA